MLVIAVQPALWSCGVLLRGSSGGEPDLDLALGGDLQNSVTFYLNLAFEGGFRPLV